MKLIAKHGDKELRPYYLLQVMSLYKNCISVTNNHFYSSSTVN